MTRGAFKAATLPRQPVDATHAAQALGSVPPIYTKGGCLAYFLGGVGAGASAGDECLEGAPREQSCARRKALGR